MLPLPDYCSYSEHSALCVLPRVPSQVQPQTFLPVLALCAGAWSFSCYLCLLSQID